MSDDRPTVLFHGRVLITAREVQLSRIDLLAYWCAHHERLGLRLVSVEWGPHVPFGAYELRFEEDRLSPVGAEVIDDFLPYWHDESGL